MPKQPAHVLVVADPSRPERSLSAAKVLAAVEPPAKGQVIYWVKGAGCPLGLGLVVRPPTAAYVSLSASWVVQAQDPAGRGVRLKVARFGERPIAWVFEQAIDLRGRILDGTHGTRKVRDGFTVGDALNLWLEHLKQHARPRTIQDAVGLDGTRGYIPLHLGDWLPRPLASVTKADLVAKHRAVTAAAGGRTGNKVLRSLKAAWNRARDVDDTLPPNLLAGRFQWNKEAVGGEHVPAHELPGWWKAVHALPGRTLRDFNLTCLFVGARAAEVAKMRWSDVDLERGTVTFPEPKGGPSAAYSVPISGFVVSLLRERQGGDSEWVFPSPSPTGTHLKKTRAPGLASPHMLRRTFCTVADGLVSAAQAQQLVNHRTGASTVHGRYIRGDEKALRAATEKVTAKLLELAGARAKLSNSRVNYPKH